MKQVAQDRAQLVDEAVANERLEGLTVDDDAKRIADRYVVGEASAKEVAEEIRARYGIVIK